MVEFYLRSHKRFITYLVLSALVTATFQYGTVAGSLPQVGYLKGIDLWMVGGLSLVFFAMLEYTTLVYIAWCTDDCKEKINICGGKVDPKKVQSVIDKIARLLYLVLLVTFLVCYIVFFVIVRLDDDRTVSAGQRNGTIVIRNDTNSDS